MGMYNFLNWEIICFFPMYCGLLLRFWILLHNDPTQCVRILSKWNCKEKTKQESPPAWTQEAYRPPRSNNSFCCHILADPPLRLDLTPPPAGPDPPLAGPDPPWLDLTPPWTWPPPGWTWPPRTWPPWLDLTPPAGPDPPWTWPPPPPLAGPDPPPSPPAGPDPPQLDLTPPPSWDLTPPGWTWPPLAGPDPPLAGPDPACGQTDWWTDTCQNITFPRTTYAGGNYGMLI